MPTLEGTLERITFHSARDGYTVARLKPRDKNYLVTIIGKLAGVQVGETLALEGEWVTHPEHGRQFEIARYQTLMPASIDGIRRYLGSGLIKGVGPMTAKRITETFGKYTLHVLEHESERLREVPGLGNRRVKQIQQAWQEQQHIKQVIIFLQELGLSPGLAVRIYKQYGAEALRIVQTQPYRLAHEVYGIGFLTADSIARSLGMARDDPQRISAGLRYTLSEASSHGHCYLPAERLILEASALLEVEPAHPAAALEFERASRAALHYAASTATASPDQADAEPLVIRADQDGQEAVYLPAFDYAEQGIAAAVARLRHAPSLMAAFYRQASWSRVFAHLSTRQSISLTERQQEAVRMALTCKVSILTGGPGTGKTTTLRTIITLLQARGYHPLLASPTGRAAKRLAETTGIEASTIHRLLEYAPQAGGSFRRNSDYPLECDILIIDEVSMLDVLLANHLLKAVPLHAHVLLVGDADQLPSVGPGRVLRDMLESAAVQHVQLDVIFRQASDSGIITNAHRINHGELPLLKGLHDFYFFAAAQPDTCAARTLELVRERIPQRFGFDPHTDIQVLSPTHKGPAGVANLNRLLQQALNPAAPGKLERSFGATTFRVGDRVLQQRNNYDLDVYNGNIGTVEGIDLEEQLLKVRFEDGRLIGYDFSLLDELTLAYTLSIHKSQGGEYPAVVIPLLLQHYNLLQRNLLYTAVTRARRLVVLVGDRRALETAVRNDRVLERYSGLVARLRSEG